MFYVEHLRKRVSEDILVRPSGLDRLVNCPGSWALEKPIPNKDSPYAIEGTNAHVHAAKILSLDFFDADLFNDEKQLEGWSGLMTYYNHVHDSLGNKKSLLKIEKKISLTNLHSKCAGTPDALFYDAEREYVHIFDFKYGYNVVHAEKNWQLLGYASKFIDVVPSTTIFKLSIVQPRALTKDPIRVSEVSFDGILNAKRTIRSKIDEAMSDNPRFKVGEHCKYCKARSICEEFKKKSNAIINELRK